MREQILKNLSTIEIKLNISRPGELAYVSGKTLYSYVNTELGIFYFLFLCCDEMYSLGEFIAPGIDETRVKINNFLYYNRLEEITNNYELIVSDINMTEENTLVME